MLEKKMQTTFLQHLATSTPLRLIGLEASMSASPSIGTTNKAMLISPCQPTSRNNSQSTGMQNQNIRNIVHSPLIPSNMARRVRTQHQQMTAPNWIKMDKSTFNKWLGASCSTPGPSIVQSSWHSATLPQTNPSPQRRPRKEFISSSTTWPRTQMPKSGTVDQI